MLLSRKNFKKFGLGGRDQSNEWETESTKTGFSNSTTASAIKSNFGFLDYPMRETDQI